jgi:hypothetical protein
LLCIVKGFCEPNKRKHLKRIKNLTIRAWNCKFRAAGYISLTDIARQKNAEEPKDVVKNWMRSKTTLEFLGLWEQLNNHDFKGVEFDHFKTQARQ